MTTSSTNLYLAGAQGEVGSRCEISFHCEWFDYVFPGTYIKVLTYRDGFFPSDYYFVF